MHAVAPSRGFPRMLHLVIIIKNILYFIQIRHTDDFPSTGTRLVNVNINNNSTMTDIMLKKDTLSYIYITKGDACVCVCVCVFAKLDQFLPVRSQFDSNQHVNSVRIATFQSANFGPLLFAFYCPLLFYENKIKNE